MLLVSCSMWVSSLLWRMCVFEVSGNFVMMFVIGLPPLLFG